MKSLAIQAKEAFNAIFSNKEIPKDIETKEIQKGEWICKVLVQELGFSPSTSQARRDIKAGALRYIKQSKQMRIFTFYKKANLL